MVAVILLAACTGGDPGPTPTAGAHAASGEPPTIDCPEPPIPPGIYAKTIRPSELPPDFRLIAGQWTWGAGVADPNCFYESWFILRVRGRAAYVDIHPYTLGPDGTIVFHGAQEPDGRYEIAIHGDRVTFTEVPGTDLECCRAPVQTTNPWILQELA